jgi:hypothetical protein
MSDSFHELDKCPFCGKEGEFLTFLVENNQWMVMCHNCGAIGPNEINPDRAVEMWNLRRPFDMLKALHTQCQDLLIEMVQQFCDKRIKNSTGETVYLHNYMSPTEEVFIYLVSNNLAVHEAGDGLIFKHKSTSAQPPKSEKK